MTIIFPTVGRNPLEEMEQKSSKRSTWTQSQKQFPRQTIQYHSNPSLAPTSNTAEAEVEQFYEDLQDLLELTPRRCSFHYRGLEFKRRK